MPEKIVFERNKETGGWEFYPTQSHPDDKPDHAQALLYLADYGVMFHIFYSESDGPISDLLAGLNEALTVHDLIVKRREK